MSVVWFPTLIRVSFCSNGSHYFKMKNGVQEYIYPDGITVRFTRLVPAPPEVVETTEGTETEGLVKMEPDDDESIKMEAQDDDSVKSEPLDDVAAVGVLEAGQMKAESDDD